MKIKVILIFGIVVIFIDSVASSFFTHTHTHTSMYVCMYVCEYVNVYFCLENTKVVWKYGYQRCLNFYLTLKKSTSLPLKSILP